MIHSRYGGNVKYDTIYLGLSKKDWINVETFDAICHNAVVRHMDYTATAGFMILWW